LGDGTGVSTPCALRYRRARWRVIVPCVSVRTRLYAFVAIALVGSVGVTSSAAVSRAGVPATVVAWSKIGGVGLGTLRYAVEYRYGGGSGSYEEYRVPGGTLDVGFDTDRVSSVMTESAYFKTPDGIGVGSQIPLGRCVKTANGSCEHRWNGFTYQPPLSAYASGYWVKPGCYGGVPTSALLEVERGTVTSLSIEYGGDSGQGCSTPPQPPLSAGERLAVTNAVKQYVSRPPSTVYAYQVSGFGLARSTRDYVFVVVGVKTKGTNVESQGFGAIFRRHGTAWSWVSDGTDQVGCGTVPIKYLAEMGLTCA
jgi:hypothetical protein